MLTRPERILLSFVMIPLFEKKVENQSNKYRPSNSSHNKGSGSVPTPKESSIVSTFFQCSKVCSHPDKFLNIRKYEMAAFKI